MILLKKIFQLITKLAILVVVGESMATPVLTSPIKYYQRLVYYLGCCLQLTRNANAVII